MPTRRRTTFLTVVMPYRFLLLLLALPTLAAQAQSPAPGVTVSGRMIDADTKAPLPYLTVQLQSTRDTAPSNGRLTNAAGAFTFAGLTRGTYVLMVRAIGYQPLRQRVLVGELSAFLDLGAVPMAKETRTLQGVTVTANADGVAESLDRKTVTVADNISQSGGSVLQAMSTVPGVTVGQDGKVLVRGSDKVVVLIDGKQTALTGFGTQSSLDNLPASALERIEVITNPSARYEANASAGIINLVMKKQDQDGFSGKVGFTGGAGALREKRANLPSVRPQFQGTPKLNPSLALN
ncbi:MAG TPA: carboxypeptidase regulatory-like domain-containing protein, partial [Gemmatimonadaceae bacterium]|nr:carboxypeptidase regulatory-like domain-containing protein [Gemmatimonadaceae bacterium]